MRRQRRKNQDQDRGEVEVTVLPDGKILLPRGNDLLVQIADALGDEKAKEFVRQAAKTEVLVGKRMCG